MILIINYYDLWSRRESGSQSPNFDIFKYFYAIKFWIIIIIVFVLPYPAAGQLASRIGYYAENKNTVIKSSSYNCNNVTLAIVTHKRCTADAIDFSAPSPVSHSHAWWVTLVRRRRRSPLVFGLCVRVCAAFTPFGLLAIAITAS